MTPDVSARVTDAPSSSADAARARVIGGLAQFYVPHLRDQDEMTEPDGALRPHWRMFVSMMDDLGHCEIVSRWDHARRLIRENGITHNVYGDPNGLARPWSLDLIPLLIPAAQWSAVGESLSQRARLLNALAADLYGPATCVSSGALPPELIYANPRFLRPAHGHHPRHGQWLHLYASDLVRRPDGRFQVMADRTQAPSGAGYSLENRIVLTRALPTIFRQCNVMRLAPFFIALRKTLASLAAANRENPRVVLLTPGPYNETYFEHAYLARYLGYTLVQGNDLTVRNSGVFLKTLSGLQRVDVILRRVDDDFCDPLELYAKSYLSVPGLLQAVRDGTVAVANAIGAGILQAPAFLPFLPALCRGTKELEYVIEHLGELVIKPAFPLMTTNPIFGTELSRQQLDELAEKIRAKPAEYIAQEHVTSFSAPVLLNNEVQSRQFLVRAFLAASEGTYTLMPGALTRVSSLPDSLSVSLQKGGGSKDTWILGEGPVSEVTLLASPSQPVELSRGGGDLPSRVADDLYWLGRYIQRAESTVRLARCIFNRLLDPNSVESPRTIERLMLELVDWPPKMENGAVRELANLILGPGDPSGLRSAINRTHSLARLLRDRISADAWGILSQLEREVSEFKGPIAEDQIDDVLGLLNRLVAGFLAFGGMSSESMTRGQAWRFLDMGLRIERAISIANLVRGTLVQPPEEEIVLLDALLEIADSSLTYRRRYLTQLQTPAALDLVIADETNPRGVAFQLAAITEHLASLPRDSSHPRHCPDYQLATQLKLSTRLADMSHLCRAEAGGREGLDVFLENLTTSLETISELVARTYFSHAALPGGFPGHHAEDGGEFGAEFGGEARGNGDPPKPGSGEISA
jgi:uncharacterized circularly permuted ATP-grasp superfamily protein/uncharacterized alpha-E superfamily protein